MSHENPTLNHEREKKIHSIEDIRKISQELPQDPEELNALTQEVSTFIIEGNANEVPQETLMALIYEIDTSENKDMSDEQKRFIEQIHEMFEAHIDKMREH